MDDGYDEAAGGDFRAGACGCGSEGGATEICDAGNVDSFVNVALAYVFVRAVVGDEAGGVIRAELCVDCLVVVVDAGEKSGGGLKAVLAGDGGVGLGALKLRIVFTGAGDGVVESYAKWCSGLGGGLRLRLDWA